MDSLKLSKGITRDALDTKSTVQQRGPDPRCLAAKFTPSVGVAPFSKSCDMYRHLSLEHWYPEHEQWYQVAVRS